MCNIRRFTDCESCTRPISTNSRSIEAGECGLTRETCFLACRLELDAVAVLLWISWCVLGGVDVFRFFRSFFFLRTHTACCTYESASCLIYLSTCADCESCTGTISTKPGSMEAGERGLTRGTHFFAHRLEVVAVAGLMWVSWCAFGGADFFVFFFPTFFFLRTHTA